MPAPQCLLLNACSSMPAPQCLLLNPCSSTPAPQLLLLNPCSSRLPKFIENTRKILIELLISQNIFLVLLRIFKFKNPTFFNTDLRPWFFPPIYSIYHTMMLLFVQNTNILYFWCLPALILCDPWRQYHEWALLKILQQLERKYPSNRYVS